MKKFNFLALFIIFLMLHVCGYIHAQGEIPDNKGKEFWVMFNKNLDNSAVSISLFITGDIATSGIVELPDGTVENFSVTPGSITTVDLPSTLLASSTDGVEDKGIKVTADEEITVYGLNQKSFTTDAYLALPVDILETEYIVMSYVNSFGGIGTTSLLGVLATADDTEVTIVPSTTAGSRPAGTAFTINLNAGQTYQLLSPGTGNDLTGTIITSNKPVAVFGGHTCANVPPGVTFCDHVIEQIPPASAFGSSFVTVPLSTRTNGDIFRILASEDGTTVTVTGSVSFSQSFTLNRGEHQELDIPSNEFTQIAANKPVLLAQYSKGQTSDGVISDPFMMLIPPFEQFQNGYTVTTPETGFDRHFINLAVPNSQVGSIILDGSTIPASEFTTIATTGFSGAQLEVAAGTHNLSGTLPFGAFMYGFGDFDSYGYPGGQALGEIGSVEKIILTLEPEIGQGNEYCFKAKATDQDDNPIAGVRVDFSITGANSAEGFVFTDSNGEAEFCYTPENSGVDNIKATLGTVTAEESITIVIPVATSIALQPESITVETGEEVCITATVLDQFNNPMSGVDVFTEVDGSVVATGNSDENGEVEYCFTPTETGTVNVLFYYEEATKVTAVVTVTEGGDVPVPDALTVDPQMISVDEGEEVCITATVWDQFDNPLAGVEVFIEIDGSVVASGNTDVNGEVEYCFTPESTGTVNVDFYYTGGQKVTAKVMVGSQENQPPVVNAGRDRMVTLPKDYIVINGIGNDPDGRFTAFKWEQLSGPPLNLIQETTANVIVTGLVPGVCEFRFSGTDNKGATSSDEMILTIRAANQLPYVNAGTDRTIVLPKDYIVVTGIGNDPDGRFTAFKWEQMSGPALTLTQANTANLVVSDLLKGVCVFRFSCTDNRGATVSDEVTITFIEANKPPVVNAGVDRTIYLPQNYIVLTGIGNDPDGRFTTFKWEQLSGPALTMVQENTANLVLTDLVDGICEFRFSATDNRGATASDEVVITLTSSTTARMKNDINVSAYPNTFRNNVNLQFQTETSESYAIEVYDMNGKSYYSKNVVSDPLFGLEHEIDLSDGNIKEGIYLIRVVNTNKGYHKVLKVIKDLK